MLAEIQNTLVGYSKCGGGEEGIYHCKFWECSIKEELGESRYS